MLVSFCVPVYNDEKYIHSCIQSIISQTDDDYELLLIDDGSIDNSYAICAQYAEQCKSVRVIHQDNKGMNVTRNNCIKNASGDWIFFVDHDDIVSPYVVSLIKKLKNINNYQIIIFKSKDFEDSDNCIKFSNQQPDNYKVLLGEIVQKICIFPYKNEVTNGLRIATPWGKIYNRKYLLDNKIEFIPELTWVEDVCFNIQAYSYAKEVLLVDSLVYGYRGNDSAFGRRYTNTLHNDFYFVTNTFINQIKKYVHNDLLKSLEYRINNRILLIFYKVLNCDICHYKNKENITKKKRYYFSIVNNHNYKNYFDSINTENLEDNDLKIIAFFTKHRFFYLTYLYIHGKQYLKKIKKLSINHF